MDEEQGYCWMSSDLIDDPAWHAKPHKKVMRKFYAAMRGEQNEFAKYFRFGPDEPDKDGHQLKMN